MLYIYIFSKTDPKICNNKLINKKIKRCNILFNYI